MSRDLGDTGSGRASRREARLRVLRREERRSELFVAWCRIALCVAGGSILLLLWLIGKIPRFSFVSGEMIVTSAIFCSLLLLGVIHRQGYAPWMKYASVVLDTAAVTALLVSFGEYRTLKSPAAVLYFIVVGLAAYRFSARLTIVAGALSVAAYGGLLAAAGILRTVSFADEMAESFTSPAVSTEDTLIRIVFLIALAVICTAIAYGYRRIIRSSALNEVRAERNRRERIRLRETLTRYMTDQVAEVVLKNGATLTGESRRATVLFCDIREFTRLSGSLSATEVVELLNDVLSRLVDVVFEFGGTLDKFLGDGLMAVFGAPLSSGRDEEMAVRSALRMRDEIDRFNAGRSEKGFPCLKIGIGVHSGEVVAGNIGSLRRLEYTVIGSTVNLASRIEQLNKTFKTDILISSATYDRVSHLVEVELEPGAEVRGVSGEVSTCRLISVRDFPDKRVGEEFVRIGVMTEEQVETVLDRQKQDPRFFGEIAVEMGFVSSEKLGMFLAAAKHSREHESVS